MALGEIDGDPARQLATYFGRRGPWGAHFARSGNNNYTAQGSNGDLTSNTPMGPWPGELLRMAIIISILYWC